MTKQIRHFSELPQWFDLAKYAEAEFLDLAGWCEQFVVRGKISAKIFSPTIELNQAEHTGKATDQIMLTLPKIRENPIVDVYKDDLLKECFAHGRLDELKKGSIYSRSVRLITISDIYKIVKRIETEKERGSKASRLIAELSGDDNDSRKWINNAEIDQEDVPVDDITRWRGEPLTICIDALVSKKVLFKQLEELLEPRFRLLESEDISIPQRRKGDAFNWFRFGVLPFIDLTIWARESGMNIPHRVMADAIFPPGEGGEETVRKTTVKLAEEVVTPSFLQTLSAEAAFEKAERNFDD